MTNEVARLWRVPITPAAYLFDEDGVTEAQIVRGAHEVLPALGVESENEDAPDLDLWKAETTRFLHQFESILPVLVPGSVAPLPMLAPYLNEGLIGRMAANRTVMLFSDPTCGPCQELYLELEARFRDFPAGLLLVVASRGSSEHVHVLKSEFGLSFPIVSHPNGALNRAFGTVETPAALLIDETGLVVSPAVVGREAILAMIDHARDGGR